MRQVPFKLLNARSLKTIGHFGFKAERKIWMNHRTRKDFTGSQRISEGWGTAVLCLAKVQSEMERRGFVRCASNVIVQLVTYTKGTAKVVFLYVVKALQEVEIGNLLRPI